MVLFEYFMFNFNLGQTCVSLNYNVFATWIQPWKFTQIEEITQKNVHKIKNKHRWFWTEPNALILQWKCCPHVQSHTKCLQGEYNVYGIWLSMMLAIMSNNRPIEVDDWYQWPKINTEILLWLLIAYTVDCVGFCGILKRSSAMAIIEFVLDNYFHLIRRISCCSIQTY